MKSSFTSLDLLTNHKNIFLPSLHHLLNRKVVRLPKKSFSGRFCEIDVDECLRDAPCKEHEICVNFYGGYNCTCAPNFVREGEYCILNSLALMEQNVMILQVEIFICRCPLGFLGRICDKRIPECEDSSCSKDETCVSTETGYKCLKPDELTSGASF
ncbi:protocadherin Fat 4 [Caerostris extrusa]|uniref:Protocadherin Fat 4 n=1 Tax=Caerostris extrusa TaxID=172846 RepID=A0AAV4SF41_CAEEX|nr:protocadherin Fat 4 [Caerostris extrusa]